jgi:hypothetical protein
MIALPSFSFAKPRITGGRDRIRSCWMNHSWCMSWWRGGRWIHFIWSTRSDVINDLVLGRFELPFIFIHRTITRYCEHQSFLWVAHNLAHITTRLSYQLQHQHLEHKRDTTCWTHVDNNTTHHRVPQGPPRDRELFITQRYSTVCVCT